MTFQWLLTLGCARCAIVIKVCEYVIFIFLLLSIQKMIGGGRPAGGLHCSTRDIPLCTVIGSFFSFDHKGDPVKQQWILNKIKKLTGGNWRNIKKAFLWQFSLFSWVCLTWLTNDDVTGQGRAMLVAGDALIHALVRLCLLSADVNDQSAWVGLHNNFRILFHIKMSAITCPWKARVKTENPLRQHSHSDVTINIFIYNNINRSLLVNQVVCIKEQFKKMKTILKFVHPHTSFRSLLLLLFYVKHERRYLTECPSCPFPYKKLDCNLHCQAPGKRINKAS